MTQVVKAIWAVFIVAYASVCLADQEPQPYPKVTASLWGTVYFMMFPGSYARLEIAEDPAEQPYGRAYRLRDNGTSEFLWEVRGWYAYETYISSDGDYLVRIGNWPSGHVPSERDLAVAFYNKGELVKSYSTAELIVDPESVIASASHYSWRDYHFQSTYLLGYTFMLKTIEGQEFRFNIETGEIIDE